MQKRRDNSTGTIYQRKNGRWQGKIRDGRLPNGKPKIIYVSGKTKTEVAKKLREVELGKKVSLQGKLPFNVYATQYLQLYRLPYLKSTSYDRLESALIYQIIPFIGDLKLENITGDDLQKMMNGLKEKGYAHSTIKKAYECVNAVFRHASDNGHINKNPMQSVKMFKSGLFEEKDKKVYELNEIKLLFEEARKCYSTGTPVYDYGEAVVLAFYTGLRAGEIVGLRKSDFNEEKRTIFVRNNVQKIKKRDSNGNQTKGYNIVEQSPKTKTSKRLINLNERAIESLRILAQRHPESEYFVCNKEGGVVPPDRLTRTFYRIEKNAGLPQYGVHVLRHTFATTLNNMSVNIKDLSKTLGHANLMTTNIYLNKKEGLSHESMERLDDCVL